jgi:hypothetical protein
LRRRLRFLIPNGISPIKYTSVYQDNINWLNSPFLKATLWDKNSHLKSMSASCIGNLLTPVNF